LKTVLETNRLILRELCAGDAAFILELVNDPDWLRFIGDRGVRTLEDARQYIASGPVDMYLRLGFGLYRVELKESGVPMGICGLIKRESLADVDIGFAFLPKFRSRGFAFEAASATMGYGRGVLGLTRIVAITSPANEDSIRLLGKLGMQFERMVSLSPDLPEVRLFAVNGPGAAGRRK
jgi:RimJ/RimL family protein N-acetyltransferase